MKFSELDIEGSLKDAISALKFTDCTPIQDKVIPQVLDCKDVAGLAQTGTGKTAAFLIPLMDRILKSKNPMPTDLPEEQSKTYEKRIFPNWRPRQCVLVLVPTRELVEQVSEGVEQLGKSSGLTSCTVYGGSSYDKQKELLAKGVDFIVATPGRLIDLYKEHIVDLKLVRAVVFDEADRMFDMGFKDDMKYILQRIPRERQFLVFSATLNFDVLNVAYQFGAEPIECDVSRDQAKAENVEDKIYHVGHDEKPAQLLSLLRAYKPKQAIIFSNFKHNVDRVARFLTANDIAAMGISSLLTQAQRNRVIAQFKAENDQNILVATDLAARGLDIKGVDLVINYELPQDAESYVHRIGRTGRAGETGRAFSLVSDRDVESLGRIEGYLKHKVETAWLEDHQLVKEFAPMTYEESEGRRPRPDSGRRQGGGGGRRPQSSDRPRNQGPRRPPRDASAGAPSSDRPPAHRDRTRGRHQGKTGEGQQQQQQASGGQGQQQRRPLNNQRNASPQGRQGQSRRDSQNQQHKRGGHQNGPRPQHGKAREGSHKPLAAKNAPTVTQKIKHFFKNLFTSPAGSNQNQSKK